MFAENEIIIKAAQDDLGNELISEIITEILDLPGAVNHLIQIVPDNFESADVENKRALVFYFLWEYLTHNPKAVKNMFREGLKED